jgi:hypothetical protein
MDDVASVGRQMEVYNAESSLGFLGSGTGSGGFFGTEG